MRHRELGVILLIQGHPKEALEKFVTARRLAKGTDVVETIDANLATGLLANDHLPEAIEQARRAIAEFPSDSERIAEEPWLVLIAAESANGQDAQARADLQKFLSTPRNWRTMAEIQKFPLLRRKPETDRRSTPRRDARGIAASLPNYRRQSNPRTSSEWRLRLSRLGSVRRRAKSHRSF